MIRPLLLRPRAESDIQSIFEWYESKRPGLGDEFLAALRARLEVIQESPEIYTVVYRNVRRAVLSRFPYLVFYVVQPARIAVLAVLHHARSPATWPRP